MSCFQASKPLFLFPLVCLQAHSAWGMPFDPETLSSNVAHAVTSLPRLSSSAPDSSSFPHLQVTLRGTPLELSLRSGDTAVEEGEEGSESPPGSKAVFSDSPNPGASVIRSPCPLPAVLFKPVTCDMPASPHAQVSSRHWYISPENGREQM